MNKSSRSLIGQCVTLCKVRLNHSQALSLMHLVLCGGGSGSESQQAKVKVFLTEKLEDVCLGVVGSHEDKTCTKKG